MGKVTWWSDVSAENPMQPQNVPVFTKPEDEEEPVQPVRRRNSGETEQAIPLVQPLIIVPYSTPMQPLYHYADGTLPIGDIDTGLMQGQPFMVGGAQPNMAYGMQQNVDEEYIDVEPVADKKSAKKGKVAKKGNAKPILNFIFSLLFAAVFVIGYFGIEVLAPYIAYTEIVEGIGGLTFVMDLVEQIMNGSFALSLDYQLIACLCFTVAAVMDVLVLLISLFRFRRKTAVMTKIFVILQVLCAIGAVVCLFVGGVSVGIGSYVLTGISFVSFLTAIIGKR